MEQGRIVPWLSGWLPACLAGCVTALLAASGGPGPTRGRLAQGRRLLRRERPAAGRASGRHDQGGDHPQHLQDHPGEVPGLALRMDWGLRCVAFKTCASEGGDHLGGFYSVLQQRICWSRPPSSKSCLAARVAPPLFRTSAAGQWSERPASGRIRNVMGCSGTALDECRFRRHGATRRISPWRLSRSRGPGHLGFRRFLHIPRARRSRVSSHTTGSPVLPTRPLAPTLQNEAAPGSQTFRFGARQHADVSDSPAFRSARSQMYQ